MLTPRKAHQLIWNRTCNSKGGVGNNMPLDLENEFLNHVFKDDINTFRANISAHSVNRSSQSLSRVIDILENFDQCSQIHEDNGHHVLSDVSEDFTLVLRVLQTEVFVPKPLCAHSTFRNITSDPKPSSRKCTSSYSTIERMLQLNNPYCKTIFN